ncbi:MAG: LysM peptidoglycan-binding domain-containing protein [Dehalococcoidia bacterium]|nr:LysM peptidoglycan-binding domain-containing protein [Dehalococcoidia bacterium]
MGHSLRIPRAAILRAAAACALLLVLAISLRATPAGATGAYHIVQPGESLSGIAAYYDIDLEQLAALNGIDDVDYVFSGQHLDLPGGAEPGPGHVTYVVEPGDSLSLIAAVHGVTLDALVAANDIADPDHLQVGAELVIPAPTPRAIQAAYAPRITHAEAEYILREVEVEYGLPSGLLLALAWQESGWQQHVVSSVGAIGLTQIMPSTAEWALEWLAPYETHWDTDPWDNARMGAAILSHWLYLTDGDIWLSLAIYYQGWGSVTTHGPFEETYGYAANILAVWPRFE